MAILGLTKLNAVNRVLYTINERPVAALNPGGASIEADAERFLDDTSSNIQSFGWPENTRFFESYTPDGSQFVTLPSDTLHFWPSGVSEYRQLVLSGDRIYDANTNGYALGTGVVTVDRIFLISFETASPKLKELITTTAGVYFQQRLRGSATMDTMLQQERALADLMADRNQSRLARRPVNIQPLIALMRPSQPQQ